ncbi:hypothetical protein SAMN05421839_13925 [Halolactibacillus halophilus]|uniref:Uncharacterized protein n=1 Tax=Halolactibacillus halophilus TaxID=306540 RepID=A0A1I5S5S0_9BACI|nr:hypothetical protein [Halolactibacillus halophilus]GEM02772.1 hypothetical protein HHA03_23040 [Halolactibacillus halophilus]SFP66027.1 hypothetical protein SAMN05421839_13925 [Halolactibacillus halophilus]
MFKTVELVLLENHANVAIDYDENNDVYNLTLIEYDSDTTGDTTTYEIKNKAVVQLKKEQIKEIIRTLKYSLVSKD